MRIAIMQPYFIPYAGYFRLFCAADLFVIYDCVQFIRRGWIHRNQLPNINGDLNWLTLPLKKAPQDVIIKDLEFADNYQSSWNERISSFPQLNATEFKQNPLYNTIQQLDSSPLEYIVSTLQITCHTLGLPFAVEYSSKLDIPETVKGEERIIEIAKNFGATEYINLSGGKTLYNADKFKHHGLDLLFLSEYSGSYDSILQRLISDNPVLLRKEMMEQSKWTI